MVERARTGLTLRRSPLRDFLDRFRRVAGVPADVAEDTTAELAPVFALLEPLEAELADVAAAAERRRQRLLEEAETEADQILADARGQGEAERAEVLKLGRRAAAAAAAEIVSAAETEAAEIRARARERAPELVARVLACVRETSP